MPFDLSCPDWWDMLQAGKTPLPELPIDHRAAGPALRCIDQLRLPDVPGQPTFREAGADWFRDIVRVIFGARDPETKENLVRELFLLIPKKNSKTTNSAALGLTALLLNRIPNARMMIIGPTQAVADTCFSQAAGMIRADQELTTLLHVDEHRKRIKHLDSDAVLEIKSFDMNVITGGIPVFTIIDELHLMSAMSYATKVIGQIRGGMIKAGSLLVFITTQSAQPPSGVFKSELQAARAIRDGQVEARGVLPVLYEFPEAMQTDEAQPWRDPELWPAVLPNLGYSFSLDWLRNEYEKAADRGDATLQIWLSQHLNIEIGLGLHRDRWIGADYWLQQGRDATLQTLLTESDVIVAGIDGGGLDDLLGLGFLGRLRGSQDWLHWGRAWAHPEAFDRRKVNDQVMRDFVAAGDLVICHDGTSDIEEVAELCARVRDLGLFPDEWAIGVDPEGVGVLVDELALVGIEQPQVAAVTQGYKLNAAIKGAPRKLKNGTLWHCRQPLMAWSVSNAATEARGNAVIVTKAASGSGKIDPLMALFNAFMLMSRNPQAKGQTPWDADPNYRMAG